MKNAKKTLLSTNSIRTRLILFYTITVFVLLAIMACFLYWMSIHLLYKADYEFLSDEVDTIQYILENKSLDRTALKEAVIDAPQHPSASIYRYFIRVFDDKHQLMIQSNDAATVMQADKYLHKSASVLGKKRYFWFSKNGNDYLLIQSPLRLGKKQNPGLIQITLDISYQHDIIRDHKLFIGLLFTGTLCALILGLLMANRGLRSLYLLTETVQTITASSLDQRIDPKAWPKELGGLGLAFNQMLDRIENSVARLQQFSADLAHELRTPVTNMIGTTEIALSKMRTIEDYREVMASNLEELQRLSSLIENMLFISRAANPQLEVQKQVIRVEDEIAMICDYYQAMADDKHIQMTCEGSAQLRANVEMFRRMLSNLLSNALKYTLEGGKIHFSIHAVNDQSVQISVRDTGIGIPSEHLPKLFDRFYRVDAARSLQPGTGLGLAIVKSIVDLHQGNISILSKPNHGTTFIITLPV